MNAEQIVLAILEGVGFLCSLASTAIVIFAAFKIPAFFKDKAEKVAITLCLFFAAALLLCADILIFCGLFGIQ